MFLIANHRRDIVLPGATLRARSGVARTIGALLGTRKAGLESPGAIARAAGRPYDPERLDLFQRLFTELSGTSPVTRRARPVDGPALPSRLRRTFDELAVLLKIRHAAMEGRPDKGPGRFKTDPNRAGSTLFVAPELLQGTLAKGFEIYRGLASPMHRAVFMMFLISEAHPSRTLTGA